MLVVMSSLTLAATVAICAMVAAPSWTMLVFAFAAVLIGAIVVVAVIAHALAEQDAQDAQAAEQPAPAPIGSLTTT